MPCLLTRGHAGMRITVATESKCDLVREVEVRDGTSRNRAPSHCLGHTVFTTTKTRTNGSQDPKSNHGTEGGGMRNCVPRAAADPGPALVYGGGIRLHHAAHSAPCHTSVRMHTGHLDLVHLPGSRLLFLPNSQRRPLSKIATVLDTRSKGLPSEAEKGNGRIGASPLPVEAGPLSPGGWAAPCPWLPRPAESPTQTHASLPHNSGRISGVGLPHSGPHHTCRISSARPPALGSDSHRGSVIAASDCW